MGVNVEETPQILFLDSTGVPTSNYTDTECQNKQKILNGIKHSSRFSEARWQKDTEPPEVEGTVSVRTDTHVCTLGVVVEPPSEQTKRRPLWRL